MAGQRDRYRFAVRQPLVELCRALAERYVEPVLRRTHGWDVETAARSGHALTSVCKNDYGRSRPYNTALWIAFCRRGEGASATTCSSSSVSTPPASATACAWDARRARPAGCCAATCRNTPSRSSAPWPTPAPWATAASAPTTDPRRSLAGPDDLRAWAAGKSLVAAKSLPPDHPLLASDELVGDILLTFDRLLPAYACAVQAEPLPFLGGRTAGDQPGGPLRRRRLLPGDVPRR